MTHIWLILLALLAFQTPAPAQRNLTSLVLGVERQFASMKDLSADFVQIFEDSLNRKTQESGHLYMARPRRMRWEYRRPEEKLFLSDGRTVFFYVPADRQVQREALSQTMDDRIPLMFLVGRARLSEEFTRFELLRTKPFLEGTRVLRMFPRRKTDLTELIMEVDPANFQIRRLLMTHTDGSRSEFVFSNIRVNTGLKAALFDFKIPPGVEVIDGIGN